MRMMLLVALLAMTGGVALADGPAERPPAPVAVDAPACRLWRYALMPLIVTKNRYLVTARLNDAPVLMIIDTGASATAVFADTASQLHLPIKPRLRMRAEGVSGSVITNPAAVDRFELGGHVLKDQFVSVLPAKRAGLSADGGGLLGASFLGHFDLEIDPAGGTLSLYGQDHCASGFLPWPGVHHAVHFKHASGDRIHLDVTIDGKTLRALMDTGAPGISLAPRGAAKLGLDLAALAETARHGTTYGVDERGVQSLAYRFDSIKLGDAERRSVPGEILTDGNDDIGDGADLLLGLAFLRHYRLWIAYAAGELYLEPIAPS